MEHLRWLAAALTSDEQRAAVMAVAHEVQNSQPKAGTPPAKSPDTTKADASPSQPTGPTKMANGVLHQETASFAKTGGEISWGGQFPRVLVHDCLTGGKQAYFQSQMKSQWADYLIDVPSSGTYEITMKAAVINDEQELEICSNGGVLATVPIPLSYGVWQVTPAVELQLNEGVQTLRVQTTTREHKRGIALRWFELRAKGT